ncbi:hypothetical protein DL93DRAFT_447520 [Clavulina sp. PMI_390]|nr:hypothetical protein DL93DRAFT_447520 [Clavulina sp. PMI_390]
MYGITMNGMILLPSALGLEEQQYRRGVADHTEQKEPRYKKRSLRQSSLRSLEPQEPHQHHPPSLSAFSPAPHADMNPIVSPSKQYLHYAVVGAAIIDVAILIFILIVALTMPAEQLHAIASILPCSSR